MLLRNHNKFCLQANVQDLCVSAESPVSPHNLERQFHSPSGLPMMVNVKGIEIVCEETRVLDVFGGLKRLCSGSY